MTTPAHSSALLTDRYELTMLQAALADGTAHRRCVFELFTRRLPPGRRYGVLAGTGRLLEELEAFRFGDEELSWLSSEGVVDRPTLDWLSDYRFRGSIRGYAEGEVYFPHSPVLVVEGTFAEAVLIETLALSILNFDSAIAAAGSRMTSAAVGRPCLEMGARRAHEHAAVAAARAAAVAGFAATSQLEAGRRYGIETIGTSAHSFTLLHDDGQAAFASQSASLGAATTLLVDTYDVAEGVRRAVEAAGTGLGAVRIDSGDLSSLAVETRRQLDALGATEPKIVVPSDPDECATAALAAAPVDSYGVGTSLVTGSGAPTCGMVYKLVAREGRSGEMEPVEKVSTLKSSRGGRKAGARRLRQGRAVEEVLVTGADDDVASWRGEAGADLRDLMVDLVSAGEVLDGWTGPEGVRRASVRHEASRAELPRGARRLSDDEAALETTTLVLRR